MPEPPRHEHHDIHVTPVVAVVIGIGTLALLACTLAWMALRVAGARELAGASEAGLPAPRVLLPKPRAALADYQRSKRAGLDSFAWDDATHEYARVPVEVAMDRLASGGPGPTP